MWDEIKASDGIVRQLQWTSRVEGNDQVTPSKSECRFPAAEVWSSVAAVPNIIPDAMTLSQYLGRGVVSRGRMTITNTLETQVFLHPYLHDDFDKEAVIQGIKNVQAALNVIPNLTWVLPPPGTTVENFVNNVGASN
jgi:cellobiose dehydrogenase (acceptor)